MKGMSIEEGINQAFAGGGHVVILGAGASIATTLDRPEINGKKLPSMDNFIDIVGLGDIIDKVPAELRSKNFESVYSNLYNDGNFPDILSEIESRVQEYFSEMQLPEQPTIYDYLVLSLRGKDLIATFNWDPFLYQAWVRCGQFTKDLPHLSFLHGNVAIGYSLEDKCCGPVGYQARQDGGAFLPTRLLYPVEKKDYNADEFTQHEWDRVKHWLSKNSNTVRVTIFGYGAPETDVEAVQLLNKAWGTPDDRAMEQFEIIDISDSDELNKKWDGFIHSHHYDIVSDYFESSLALNPRRTSESYFSHYEPLTPAEAFRSSNPVPKSFKTLQDLWEWHRPLIDAEIKSTKKKEEKYSKFARRSEIRSKQNRKNKSKIRTNKQIAERLKKKKRK